MPNTVENFVAWKVLWFVYSKLKSIRMSAGYNTDPLVTMEYHRYKESTVDEALFLECDSHNAEEHGIGGSGGVPRIYQVVQLTIHGSVHYRASIPRKAAMALEQDCRTAIHSAITSIRASLGRGFVFEFADCEHDGGELAPDREAGFRLSVRFGYPQGKTW